MFDKYCRGKEVESGPLPADTLPNQFDAGRRTSVSAECWNEACGTAAVKGCFGTRAETVRRVSKPTPLFKSGWGDEDAGNVPPPSDAAALPELTHEPTPERAAMLKRAEASLRRMVIFEELNADLMQRVLDSMQERECPENTDVITQGDEGAELFVLDHGAVEYLVNGKVVGHASDGATFGELALLYNSPRAATVHATIPCSMLTLDRVTLKNIIVEKNSQKRLHSQQVLSQSDVFANLPPSLQLRIADALHPETFARGETVIRQGDRGAEFFLIDEGSVEIVVDGKVVATQGSGSYFGELALIYDVPRAATVRVASDKLKVEALNAQGFERLIGADLVAELRKRDPSKSH